MPDVFTFAKELGDGDDNASVGVDTAASSQFLLGGDNVQTLNAGTEGDAIFGGKGDDIINLGGGKDFVFYRYDGDDSEAWDGGDKLILLRAREAEPAPTPTIKTVRCLEESEDQYAFGPR